MDAWRSVKLISTTNQQRLRLRPVHPHRHHTPLSTNSYITRFILRTTCFLLSEYKTTNCISTYSGRTQETNQRCRLQDDGDQLRHDWGRTFNQFTRKSTQPQPNRLSSVRWRPKQGRKERRKKYRNQRIVLGGSRPLGRILTTDQSMSVQLSNIINRKRTAESLAAARKLAEVNQCHAPPKKRRRNT